MGTFDSILTNVRSQSRAPCKAVACKRVQVPPPPARRRDLPLSARTVAGVRCGARG